MFSTLSLPSHVNGRRGLRSGLQSAARRESKGLRRSGLGRSGGFVTPVGWVYLILVLVVVVVVTATLVWFIASANVVVAKRTAELVANAGAVVGLEHLVTGVLPGTPFPVLALPEPQRTQAVIDQINLVAVPTGVLAKYLAPFEAGDIDLTVSMIAASVTVTARTGRHGQFVRSASRSAATRAANAIEAGRVLEMVDGNTPRSAGVLPLAIDASAFAAPTNLRALANGAAGRAPSRLQLALGGNAFPVGADSESSSLESESEFLLAASEFLGFDGVGTPGGLAPPAFEVGQQLRFAQLDPLQGAEALSVADSVEVTLASTTVTSAPEIEADAQQARNRRITDTLLRHLEGRAVIVPLVDGGRIQGFAVATVERAADQGIALELLPSALSPLAKFESEGRTVPEALAQSTGLALGFSLPSSDDERTRQNFFDAECCDPEITDQQAILSPVEIAG